MPDDLTPQADVPAGTAPGEGAMRSIRGREIAALLNPRPAVPVTCCDAQGRPNVMTAAWQTPLSHEPPLLGISIDLRRYSHALLQQVHPARPVCHLDLHQIHLIRGLCHDIEHHRFKAIRQSIDFFRAATAERAG